MATAVTTQSLSESILAAEIQCEYEHYLVVPCTLTVTHRVTSCDADSFNVCRAAVAVVRDRLTRDQCVDCGRRASDCWQLIPV